MTSSPTPNQETAMPELTSNMKSVLTIITETPAQTAAQIAGQIPSAKPASVTSTLRALVRRGHLLHLEDGTYTMAVVENDEPEGPGLPVTVKTAVYAAQATDRGLEFTNTGYAKMLTVKGCPVAAYVTTDGTWATVKDGDTKTEAWSLYRTVDAAHPVRTGGFRTCTDAFAPASLKG